METPALFDPNTAPRIETERLVLRAWRASDLDPFAAMMADADVARFLANDQLPRDRASAWRDMAIFVGHWALRGYGLFAVEDRASGEFVGRIGAWRPEGWIGLELGWALARAHWGKGYGLEAARAAGDWVFTSQAPERLVSVIHANNTRSQTLARRLGMSVSSATIHAGMPHDIWAVSPQEWDATVARR
ncbi:MAG: GNAT family N-acetyltransferase [Hyphomonadaceae bacterium]